MITVIVSGYFDPLHVGHLKYFEAAKKLGDRLIVIVNNDKQAELKKGKPFMPAVERAEIIKNLRMVDKVILSIDEDRTVCKTLRKIYDNIFDNSEIIFANGDDVTSCPEEEALKGTSIKFVYGVGGGKIQSSSWLIEKSKM